MSISEVGSGSQRAKGTGAGVDSVGVAFPGNVTSGNLLHASWSNYNASATSGDTYTVTDSRSTSYAQRVSSATLWFGQGCNVGLAWGVAASGGACTVTINPSGTGDYIVAAIDEFASDVGWDADPLDVDGGESSGTGTDVGDDITTLTNPSLILGVMADYNTSAGPSITPDGGYTQIAEEEPLDIIPYSGVFQIVTTATTYTVGWTLGSSSPWRVYTVALKETAGGGGGGSTHHIHLPLLGVG